VNEHQDRTAIADDFDDWAVHHADFYEPGSRLDREFRASRMLVLAGRRWTKMVDGLLKARVGQSRARWETMFAIAFSEPPVTTIALAHRLQVQWPTLIRVLDALEQEGMIQRIDNPADRRSRFIALSDEGQRTIREIQTILDGERHAVLVQLNDAELAQCMTLLTRMFTHTPVRHAAEPAADL